MHNINPILVGLFSSNIGREGGGSECHGGLHDSPSARHDVLPTLKPNLKDPSSHQKLKTKTDYESGDQVKQFSKRKNSKNKNKKKFATTANL